MKKTMMLVLVCVIALTGVMSLNVFAADIWDGTTVDTSWYDANNEDFTIDTAAKLAGLAQIVNGTADEISQDSFSGKTVTLGDLNGCEWDPIGSEAWSFQGTFDGNNCTISNLYIENTDLIYAGLFGFAQGYTIKN